MMIKRTFISLFLGISLLSACTSLILDRSNSGFLAKNLDWEIDRGYLYYNLDGIDKSSVEDQNFTWRAKYKSITNNQFGKEFPLGGMNEKGLVIEEMSLFGQDYIHDESKFLLNEFQWVQYQLDMSSSVEEVIHSFNKITIRHAIMNLHYLIMDDSGDCAVIECLEGGIEIHRGDELPYPVLSNNPYKNSLRYLSFFEGYGGDLNVEHRSGSQERFVSAVWYLDQYKNEAPLEYVFKILETVKQADTRWQFLYDPRKLEIEIKTHDCNESFPIGFEELEKVKHNKFAVTLFGGKHKKIKMNTRKNQDQLEYIHKNLQEYFPGIGEVYEEIIEEGEKSLRSK